MIDATIERQLHEELLHLNLDQQRRVLEYAHGLARTKPPGASGAVLAGLIGIFTPDELKAMSEAIEEGCGQVDLDDWQ